MQRKYIRVTELASSPKRDGRWPAARATIWRWVKTGRLPQPVRLSGASSTPTRTEAVQAAGLRSAAVRRARREGGEQ